MDNLSTYVQVVLLAVAAGFIVSFVTELVLGRVKAHRLPGGPITAGLMAGIALQAGFALVILGAIFGTLGWILYRLILPIKR